MSDATWLFRLYIAGRTPLSQRAEHNLRALIDHHFPDGATIEVIDLREDPAAALEQRILAVPTVVRERPEPRGRIIGDLSNRAEASSALNLPPAPDEPVP